MARAPKLWRLPSRLPPFRRHNLGPVGRQDAGVFTGGKATAGTDVNRPTDKSSDREERSGVCLNVRSLR